MFVSEEKVIKSEVILEDDERPSNATNEEAPDEPMEEGTNTQSIILTSQLVFVMFFMNFRRRRVRG